MTTVCPGPVATDIARNISGNSIVARILIPIFFLAQAKSPDYGARIYVNASVAKPEIHVIPPTPASRVLSSCLSFFTTYQTAFWVHYSPSAVRVNSSAITCQTNNTKRTSKPSSPPLRLLSKNPICPTFPVQYPEPTLKCILSAQQPIKTHDLKSRSPQDADRDLEGDQGDVARTGSCRSRYAAAAAATITTTPDFGNPLPLLFPTSFSRCIV